MSYSKTYICYFMQDSSYLHNYSSFIWPFESEKRGKEGEKITKTWISHRTKRTFQMKLKPIFIIFEMLFFGKIYKIEDTNFKNISALFLISHRISLISVFMFSNETLKPFTYPKKSFINVNKDLQIPICLIIDPKLQVCNFAKFHSKIIPLS